MLVRLRVKARFTTLCREAIEFRRCSVTIRIVARTCRRWARRASGSAAGAGGRQRLWSDPDSGRHRRLRGSCRHLWERDLRRSEPHGPNGAIALALGAWQGKALQVLAEEVEREGLPLSVSAKLSGSDRRKVRVVQALLKGTTVDQSWIAQQLGTKTASSISQILEARNVNSCQDLLANSLSFYGQVVVVNDGDADGDGIPDYADGYGLHSGIEAEASSDSAFTPVFANYAVADWAAAKIRFTYDASDPLAVAPSSSALGVSQHILTGIELLSKAVR